MNFSMTVNFHLLVTHCRCHAICLLWEALGDVNAANIFKVNQLGATLAPCIH